MDNKQILETLHIVPLSDEEKAKRHILARLYGPIATFGDATRNGRYYNKQLWEKALSDEIFLEKVANKSLFLELEHPTDRDQIDMKLACACIPEVPKIVGNDLYAVIDILDTPNGKLLKTFVDYGFVPGISSRGSGDVNANDEVDPETFFLETWDIVSLPAVKKARLSVCESFDPKKGRLKKALCEALNSSSEEDKKIMKETLDNMDINLESDVELTEASDVFPGGTPKNSALLPVAEISDDEFEKYESLEEDADGEEIEDAEAMEDEEESAEEITDETEETEEETDSTLTVKNIIDDFENLGEDKIVEFEPVEIEGIKYNTNVVIKDQDDEKVILGVECTPIEEDTEDRETDNSYDEEDADEADDETEEAVDDGDEEVVESFKDLVRQKDLLESEVKALKNEKTVSDAKVNELQEALDKYKAAFARTSELAAKAKEYKTLNESLNSRLEENTQQIAELKNRVKTNTKLHESINANATQVKALTEKLNAAKVEFTESKTKLEAQVAQANQKLQERTNLAKKYKASYLQVVERYIVSKAKLLGVKPAEITSKLNESYTLDDIDNVCDTILTESVGMKRLPFSTNSKARVQINESKLSEKNSLINPDNGYEVDDSLLELAGLK